ncbi:MAG TPA: thermonuclease family protein [Cyclobacteriaceae bacterium]
MKKLIVLVSVWLGSFCYTLASEEITGKVISVIDGNTLEILSSANETHKVMLAGIDSPELQQEFGDKAKKFLEKITLEKSVTVKMVGKDRWGNYLAEVVVEGKFDPRVELLKEGLAWTAERNPLPELEEYRTKAQEKGKGLWKQNDPTPPWIYRRQQTMLQPKSSS